MSNVSTTKELIVDFRRPGYTHRAIQIQDEKAEIVHSCKYLGTIFEDTLKWDLNTEAIIKKSTSDSFCCGSSDFSMLIQLFLSYVITLLLRTF